MLIQGFYAVWRQECLSIERVVKVMREAGTSFLFAFLVQFLSVFIVDNDMIFGAIIISKFGSVATPLNQALQSLIYKIHHLSTSFSFFSFVIELYSVGKCAYWIWSC